MDIFLCMPITACIFWRKKNPGVCARHTSTTYSSFSTKSERPSETSSSNRFCPQSRSKTWDQCHGHSRHLFCGTVPLELSKFLKSSTPWIFWKNPKRPVDNKNSPPCAPRPPTQIFQKMLRVIPSCMPPVIKSSCDPFNDHNLDPLSNGSG